MRASGVIDQVNRLDGFGCFGCRGLHQFAVVKTTVSKCCPLWKGICPLFAGHPSLWGHHSGSGGHQYAPTGLSTTFTVCHMIIRSPVIDQFST